MRILYQCSERSAIFLGGGVWPELAVHQSVRVVILFWFPLMMAVRGNGSRLSWIWFQHNYPTMDFERPCRLSHPKFETLWRPSLPPSLLPPLPRLHFPPPPKMTSLPRHLLEPHIHTWMNHSVRWWRQWTGYRTEQFGSGTTLFFCCVETQGAKAGGAKWR